MLPSSSLQLFSQKIENGGVTGPFVYVVLKEKLGLHSLTKAINAGTSDFRVQKMMRVSSFSMLDHYSVADHQFLLQTSKSAF